MKNLQKVLALGLALIMLMGMFTVASAAEAKVATDLSDWDSIKHQNAVALNVDLGIIKGMPDGSYKPTENIDRASWAKLAYVAACGDEDADAYLGTVTGLKDIAGNWAEAYISYLAANKYISGDETGNYNPSNNVTVVEACKTMLTILGYNAKDRGYENDAAWSGKIMSDAKANGLMDDVDREQTAMKPLTRENAAQIIYNALAAQTVEEVKTYDQGNQYVSRYDKEDPLGYKVFNLVKLEGVATGIEPDSTITFGSMTAVDSTYSPNSLAKINKLVGGSLADVGQLCNVFVKGVTSFDHDNNIVNAAVRVDELVSANVAPSDSEPLVTVTKGAAFGTGTTRLQNIWKPGHDDYVGAEPQLNDDGTEHLKFYVNGKLAAAGTTDVNAAKGDVARLYDLEDKDGKVDTIVIIHYSVGKVTGAVRNKLDATGKDTVLIPGVTAGKYVPVSQVSGPYASLKKDDIVLFYTNGETDADKMVVTVEIPETFTGKVTGVNQTKGQLTIGGSAYDYSAINGSAQGGTSEAKVKGWNDLENEYTFYKDPNGGLAYAVKNTDSAVAGNVAVVLESKWISGGTIDASNYMQAKLMLADGDVVITPIDRVGMKNGDEIVSCIPTSTKTATVDYTNKYVNYATITGDSDLNGSLNFADGFWSYKVNASGHYEITKLADQDEDWGADKAIAADAKIEKKPAFTTGQNANVNTVFMIEKVDKDDNSTFEIYTGYANVPAMNAGTGSSVVVGGVAIHEMNDDVSNPQELGQAAYVYIKTHAYADDLPDGLVFLRSDVVIKNASDEFTIEVVDAKGEATTMKKDSNLSDLSGILKMYTVDAISNGVATDMTLAATNPAKGVYVGTLKGIGGGVVTFNETMTASDGTNATSCGYDDSTVVVLIDLKYKDGALAFDSSTVLEGDIEVDTDSSVYAAGTQLYVIQDDGLATYVYIVRAPIAAS